MVALSWKLPLSARPMPTSTVTAVSVRVTLARRAAALRALWKQAA
jgi:hypothetical protein